jgi:DNA-binding transcriptional ArsR family regulator
MRSEYRAVKRIVGEADLEEGLAAEDACEVRGADLERVREGRAFLLPSDQYSSLAESFRALADTNRARIVHSLLRQELCTCDLAAITRLSEPAVSQHLRLLRDLRMVKTRRVGRKVYYSLDDAHVRAILDLSLRHLAHRGEADGDESEDETAEQRSRAG